MADTRGAEDKLAQAQRAVNLRTTIREVSDDAVLILAEHASSIKGRWPSTSKTGRLPRSIAAHPDGDGVAITADAKDPRTGFDYVAVTRFGHRVARIYPSKNRARASVLTTKRRRHTGRSAGDHPALAVPIGGSLHFFSSVRGFHPATDWVLDSIPEIQVEADRAMRRLGQRIELHR